MRRFYAFLIAVICILLLGSVLFYLYRQNLYQNAENLLALRLGIEPSLETIDQYLDDQFRIGRTKEEIDTLLDKVKPDAIVQTRIYAWQDADTMCYHVMFDTTMQGIRLLNRYLCYDHAGILINAQREPYFQ